MSEGAKKYCPNCGDRVSHKVTRCSYCGQRIYTLRLVAIYVVAAIVVVAAFFLALNYLKIGFFK